MLIVDMFLGLCVFIHVTLLMVRMFMGLYVIDSGHYTHSGYVPGPVCCLFRLLYSQWICSWTCVLFIQVTILAVDMSLGLSVGTTGRKFMT